MEKVNANITFIDRNDLNRDAQSKNIRNIILKHVLEIDIIKDSEVVIFIDNDNKQKVLKNRFLKWSKEDENRWADEEYGVLREQEKHIFGGS